jgi:hypothetical protein
MRKLLLQLDGSPHPSAFDRIVALDAGADEVLSYGGVTEDAVRDLVHGAIFTRAPKDLRNTAIFVGGTDIAAAERLLAQVQQTFFGPMRVSVMLDPNGSNTTAVAAAMKLQRVAGDVPHRRVVVVAGTGPVGMRAAGLLARAGAEVTITSRREDAGAAAADRIRQRFRGTVRAMAMADASHASTVLEGAELLLSAGGAGVRLVPQPAWLGRAGLLGAADVNAVPPLGIEGVEVTDDGKDRSGTATIGALAIGNLKMKIHRACIVRLFERNDIVLDAETIAAVGQELESART